MPGNVPEFDDNTTLPDFLEQIAFNLDKANVLAEVRKWHAVFPSQVITVGDLRDFLYNRREWHRLALPRAVKTEVEKVLDFNGVEEEELPDNIRKSTAGSNGTPTPKQNRRRSALSPHVVSLFERETKNTIIDSSELEGAAFSELDSMAKEIGINPTDDEMTERQKVVMLRGGKSGGETLDEEQKEWVRRVLECAQRVHAMGVARLYVCKERERVWNYTGLMGAVVIITESNCQMMCSHFIRLIDLEAWNPIGAVCFEQELYEGIEYRALTPFFHTFEIDNYVAGLSFASEEEAEFFLGQVQFCIENDPQEVVEEEYESKEKAYMRVGDQAVSVAGDEAAARLARKYAGGGTADGTDLKWNKPAVPQELAQALGIDPEEKPKEEEEKKEADDPRGGKSGFIDLINDTSQPIRKLDRRATICMGGSESLFVDGRKDIQDGTTLRWSRNAKPLSDNPKERSQEEVRQELEATRAKLKRLTDMRKQLLQTGDREQANKLDVEIESLKQKYREINSVAREAAKEPRKNRRKSLVMRLKR